MKSITTSINSGVATLTLNRPEVFNSFNGEMALLLQSQLDACEADPNIRAIVITGQGKALRRPGFKRSNNSRITPRI